MKVIHNEAHGRHDPSHQFASGRQSKHADAPARIERILSALREADFEVIPPRFYCVDAVRTVHSKDYVDYLSGAYEAWVAAGKSPAGVIPGTFPVRAIRRRPDDLSRRAGWHCLDTETPITEHTFEAAVGSACCALTAADLLLAGESRAYALCRPPGHHAGRDHCGGYCYFNNAALAATRLRDGSGTACKVAILDVDAHHGNGTQSIFYESSDVLYASVHADPNVTYPYYWGYAEETGAGAGGGFNLNVPLSPRADETTYFGALARALEATQRFGPDFLVVSLGTDGSAYDRLGPFALSTEAFAEMGQRIAEAGVPTLVVQEGGYHLATLGECVALFLKAL